MHSGRVLLFNVMKQHNSDIFESKLVPGANSNYDINPGGLKLYCFWYCALPSPVRDIQAVVTKDELFTDLIVCTQKSVHLLRSDSSYIAEAIFERVEHMLHRYHQA